MSGRTKGILAIVASAFGFALMAFFVRLCDDFGPHLTTFQKSFFRNLVAFAVALAVFWRTHPSQGGLQALVPSPRAWGLLALRSLLGTSGILCNFYALGIVPIAVGQTLNKTAPFFTVLFAWLFLRERPALRQLRGLLVAAVGVLLITKPGFAGAQAFPLAAGLLGGLCAGSAYACLRALRKEGANAAFIVLVFSAISCFACLPEVVLHPRAMTFAQFVVLMGAGASAALGQFGITLAYGYAAPREIAVYDYSNILFTALLGFCFFGQIPDALAVLGALVIVLAAFALWKSGRVHDHARPLAATARQPQSIHDQTV